MIFIIGSMPQQEEFAMMSDVNNENLTTIEVDNTNQMTIREEKLKTNLTTRLNRIEGQVRGVKGMIERDVYCNDVLVQISAVQSALDSVSKLVLENHIRGCLVKKIQAGDKEIVDELLVTIGKLL